MCWQYSYLSRQNNSEYWQRCGKWVLWFSSIGFAWIGCEDSGKEVLRIRNRDWWLVCLISIQDLFWSIWSHPDCKFLVSRLFFGDQGSFIIALRLGLKIESELIHVYELKKIPRFCNECQSPEHLIANCPSTYYKWARYSGPQKYCKDTPYLKHSIVFAMFKLCMLLVNLVWMRLWFWF